MNSTSDTAVLSAVRPESEACNLLKPERFAFIKRDSESSAIA